MGTVTNVGLEPLSGLLTAIHLKEIGGTLGISDVKAWLSPDGISWPWQAVIKESTYSDYQIEILIGPPGGYSLDVGASSTTYVKIEACRDITEIVGEVIVFVDTDLDYNYDPGETIVSSNDSPVRLDLAVWHTVEICPAKFYWSIQEAINAASPGDTIFVYSGTYNEKLVIVKSYLIIQGASREDVILDGSGLNAEHGIEVRDGAVGVVIENFTIKNFAAGYYPFAIWIYRSSSCTVRNMIIEDSGGGINIYGGGSASDTSNYNIIEDNIIRNIQGNAIAIYGGAGGTCSGNIIRRNKITDCGLAWTYIPIIAVFAGANNNVIENNELSMTGTNIGKGYGIALWGVLADGKTDKPAMGNIIQYNSISNFYLGIYIAGHNTYTGTLNLVSNTVIEGNDIKFNRIGVAIKGFNSSGKPGRLNYNNIVGNTEYGVCNKPYNENVYPSYDARYNWWGDPSGPHNPTLNPSGIGDNVSDNVCFEPWLTSSFVPPLIHDISVVSVTPSVVRATPGTVIQVNVEVKNEGNTFENFTVSLYYDNNLIGSEMITDMVPGSTLDLTFSWDTTGVPYGTYTLKAEASIVPGETDTADNTLVDGSVRIGPEAAIKVEPSLFQAQLLNKTFQVNVTISGLWEGWRAVGVQFRLTYDDTLLEVVDVSEGSFMRDSRWNRYGTFFIWDDRPGDPIYGTHVIVGILLLPNPDNGQWAAFPSGDGVLATITFRTIYQERGLEKPPLTCELKLIDTMVIDDDLQEIPLTLKHGMYEMYPTHIGDINYDGKVDIKDVAMVSRAFGSMPDYGAWNPICDINGDGKVDIKDVALVSRGFGWTKTYDP